MNAPAPAKSVLVYSEAFCPISETFVYRIARALAPYAVSVVTHARQNASEFPDDGLDIRVRPLRRRAAPVRALAAAWNNARWRIPAAHVLTRRDVGEGRRPDLIFAQFATCGYRSIPAARELSVPHVTMFHGCDLGSWLRFRRYRQCLDTLFAEGTAFIVATEFMRERAIGLGCPRERLHKIPYPIPDLGAVDGEARSADGSFRFLHVGRLHEQKGILYSIRAFAAVHAKAPRTEFVIVGDGPERAAAEDLVRELGLEDSVSFRGAVPFSRVGEELRLAHAYVIHSVTTADGDTEGFGVSLAEASQTQLPIVATRHNGFPDVVLDGTTGYLVPERDVDAMAACMLRLAEDRELCGSLGAAGRRHVQSSFDSLHVGAKFQALFRELL
jgi:colanic acid/amylovoran biosynthesis glycosyltransferase